MLFIAIDCGASFTKGALLDEQGNIQKQISIQTTSQKPIINGIKKNVLEILDTFIMEEDEYVLGISNEMHGFILTDSNGAEITDYISWQCEYGRRVYEDGVSYKEYIAELLTESEINSTGMQIKDGLPSVNLFYLVNTILQNKKSQQLFFYTLGDYLIYSLSGQQPGCHPTNAAATGIYDIYENKWNSEIIDKLGFKEIIFPCIECNKEIRFERKRKKIVVYPAVGDQQAALLGAGIKERIISFNFGTGAQISVLTTKKEMPQRYQIRPFFNGYYLKTIPHIPSGRAMNVFFRFVKEIARNLNEKITDDVVWKMIWESVNQVNVQDKTECLDIDLSFFANAVTQHETGHISNINETNFTLGNLFLSIFKKMSENAIRLADELTANIEEINEIVFTGGVLQKNKILLNAISVHYNGLPVRMVRNETIEGLYLFLKECKRQIK